jgi:DNA primase
MGTALTGEQVKLIGRAAKRIVVVFDGDKAGARAAEKAIPVAVEAGLFFAEADADGRVAQMPEGVDPDDFVRTQGADAFRALVEGARPMLDHLIQQAADDATIPGKAETARRVVEVLAKVKNPLVRDLYQRELAAKLGVPATHVARMVRDAAFDKRASGAQASPPKPAVQEGPTREPARDELDLLTLLLNRPELATSDDASRGLELLVDPDVRQFYRLALESARQGGRMDVPTWLDSCPAETRAAIGAAVMDGRWDKLENTGEAFHVLVGRLERSRLQAEIVLAKRQREEALARGDEEEARAISVREMELIRSKLGLVN